MSTKAEITERLFFEPFAQTKGGITTVDIRSRAGKYSAGTVVPEHADASGITAERIDVSRISVQIPEK